MATRDLTRQEMLTPHHRQYLTSSLSSLYVNFFTLPETGLSHINAVLSPLPCSTFRSRALKQVFSCPPTNLESDKKNISTSLFYLFLVSAGVHSLYICAVSNKKRIKNTCDFIRFTFRIGVVHPGMCRIGV